MQHQVATRPKPLSSHTRPGQDLFPPSGGYRPSHFYPQRAHRKLRSALLALGFLFFMLSIFGFYGVLKRPTLAVPFVLVELRAIEEAGHPVTGAQVSINAVPMGLTDSFGEWKRYLRLRAGEKLSVSMVKHGETLWRGSGQYQVGFQDADGKNRSVKGTLELKKVRQQISGRPKPAVVPKIEDEGPRPESLAGSVTSAKLNLDLKTAPAVSEAAAEPISDTADGLVGVFLDDDFSAIALQSVKAAEVRSEDKAHPELPDRILPLLGTELGKLGLRIDHRASWKMALSELKGTTTALRAEITWKHSNGDLARAAFIIGAAKAPGDMVRALCNLLRMHMQKSFWAYKENGAWFIDEDTSKKSFWTVKAGMALIDTNGERFHLNLAEQFAHKKRWRVSTASNAPCSSFRKQFRCLLRTQSAQDGPPLVGWRQQMIRVEGVVPPQSELFVAGFQAQSLGGGRWNYWGHPGSSHKAQLVHQGKIIHSEIFADQAAARPVLHILPAVGSRQARR